jgi:hypothetical protein
MNAEASQVIQVEGRTPKRDMSVTTVIPATPSNPMELLALAVSRGDDIEKIEKLMGLQERWQANQAKAAFTRALNAFKKDPPDVIKDMQNNQYGSDYSSLPNLANTVNPALALHDLSAIWKPKQEQKDISVTCVLTHVDGHSEEVTISGPPDTSGAKNPLQQIKSTLTYLEIATFQAVTGIVARSACQDDDGNGAGQPQGKANGRPQKEAPAAPEGYDSWAADMAAVADEGTAKLLASWEKSSKEFRRYAVTHEAAWWTRMKNRAAKVAA